MAERENERRAAEKAQNASREAERQAKASSKHVQSSNGNGNGSGNSNGGREKKQLVALEREIAQLEERKAALDAEIMQASVKQQGQRIGELGSQYATLETQLGDCYNRWAELAEKAA